MSELTGSNHRCRAQFKCVQTVVCQCFAGKMDPTVCPTTTTITTTSRSFVSKFEADWMILPLSSNINAAIIYFWC